MTPLQLAAEECANHEHNGACLGVELGDMGQITHCSPKPRCALSAGERCAYFEECVAPMAGMVTEPRRAAAIKAAVYSYHMAHGGVVTQHRRGGQCGSSTSQKPQQGLCLPLQQRQRPNPYQSGGQPQNGNLTVAVKAPGVCEMERSVVA